MQHLAMIMDGNRRWAREQKLQAVTMGHRKGADAVGVAIKFCLKRGIKNLSLYAFSIENFKRSETEKTVIFGLLAELIKKNLSTFIAQGICVRFIGDRDLFPPQIKTDLIEAEEATKHLNTLSLNLLFCYGAQQEIVCATKKIAQRVQRGELDPALVNEAVFREELWTTGIPDPDLIIRTGGAVRLSNFLLFQAAYSELKILDCFWPEINEDRLQQCVDEFERVQKNLGK